MVFAKIGRKNKILKQYKIDCVVELLKGHSCVDCSKWKKNYLSIVYDKEVSQWPESKQCILEKDESNGSCPKWLPHYMDS